MPLVTVEEDTFGNAKEALDLILGPPGEGAFAASPGHPDSNAPGQAQFYPNTVSGRERYLRDSERWERESRNNFFSSVVWEQAALGQHRSLTIGGAVQPQEFWCLWCDVDKGLTDESRALIEQLTARGCILSYSGGKTASGKRRFHLRVLLGSPITDVDEFYALNRWLARSLNGEKFAPVSWLTLPGSTRYKKDYPGGQAETTVKVARGGKRWTVAELKKLLARYADEPTGGPLGADASDLEAETVEGALPVEIRRMLRQKDPGDGMARHKQTSKLVKLCAENGFTKPQALWVLQKHEPSVAKFGDHRLPSQVHACWPLTQVEVLDDGLLSGVRTGDWLAKQVFPPLVWAVPDVIPEGLGMIVAPPKAGKSWWVANIALACAAGGKALGLLEVAQRPVLYMALEDSHRRLQDRFIMLMGEGQGIPSAIHVLINCEPNVMIPTILEFLAKHTKCTPLVIVDTLGKARGNGKAKNEDSYAADYEFTSQLKNAVDQTQGAALLMVHHTRKAESDDFVNSASGTHGIAGAMDFILALQRKRNSNDAVLHLTGRDVEENSFAMRFNRGAWSLDGSSLADAASALETKTEALGDRSKSILTYINDTAPNTVKASDLVTHLGLSLSAAGVYLKRLHDKEIIGKRARGEYISLKSQNNTPPEVIEL